MKKMFLAQAYCCFLQLGLMFQSYQKETANDQMTGISNELIQKDQVE